MVNRQHCRPPSLVPPLRSTATSRNHLAMIHGKRDDLINDNDNKSHWRTARRPKPRRPSSSSSGQLQSCWSSSSSTSFSISSSPCFSLPSFMAVNGLPSLNTNTTTKTTLLRKQHPPRRWRSEETCLSSSMLPLRFNLILVILVSIPLFAQALVPLSNSIRHYEPLSYDHKPTQELMHRARRAASDYHVDHPLANPLIEIEFNAHGRHFPLRLKRDIDSVFHSDLVIEDGDGRPLSVNLDHLVSGQLHQQPNSVVFGSIRDGVFEGRIHSTLPNETVFYVERSHKYFPLESTTIYLLDRDRINGTHSGRYNLYDLVQSEKMARTTSPVPHRRNSLPFHSVIYSSDHVIDPHHSKRSPTDGACGADPEVRAWMDQIANSAVVDEPDNNNINDNDDPNNRTQLNRTKRSSNFYHNYRIPSEAQGRISYSKPTNPPQPSSPTLPSRRACSLYIQTDTFLWDHVKKHESEKSDFKVREEIASLVAQHIKAVNHIYETSIFKDIIGLKFIVQRLRINDSSSCDIHKREHNQFCSPNIDVSNFLNLNSQFNHNDFCLAYIFTYRDFSGGTLGLAWVASTSGASGGICEKYKTYTENIGGRQVQTKRSLNTGIITFVNYNSRVPPKVSELTLAHEIGHNFGSPHDYPAECRPGGPMGNFIMYSSATSGERQNNNKFSHCSVNNISSVLHAVFSNEGKENCFQEDNGPFCGNKIVEEGEECDCGYDSRECNEDCCYPRNVDEFKLRDPYAQPCRRRPGSYCSPSEGPCCTERCTFEGETKQCRDVGECTYKSLCDGQRAHCPLPPAKPNKTECNMGTQVCWRGSCTGSICQKYDLEECFLTAKRGSKSDEMCEVACQRRSQPETCRRTSEIEKMKNISGLRLRPGSPCNDFQGYCDVFQRCRPVDAEGPLARLKNLLFNKKTLISIKQWVTTYWWACTLVMFGAMLVMAAFIKCCAVHTPSSNPKRKKALRLSETLRRPADTLRRKSRDRLNGQSRNGGAGAHGQRSSREHGNGRNGHRSDGSRSQSSSAAHHNSSSSTSSQQLPLTNIHHTSQAAPSSSSQSSSSNYVRSGYPNHSSVPTSSSVNANNNNINNHSQSSTTFPPTLVVNLPPAKEMNLPQQPFDPPPPYPGIPKPNAPPLNIVVSPSINGGPSHGYGEGRGHYNRHGQTNVPTSAKIPGLSKGGHGNGKLKGDSESKSRRS